jgi:SAM-dependent methyltransferase
MAAAGSRTTPHFEELTETTGISLTEEGTAMMYTRYVVGAELSTGKRVLELACGTGQGLGLLGARARSVVGADVSHVLLRDARRHYGTRFALARLTADQLPFAEAAFDIVLCFEASYYVPDMDRAFQEIARVLSPGGAALFVNANPERPDFIQSAHSTHYHTAQEFREALECRGFKVTVEGAFPLGAGNHGAGARVVQHGLAWARGLLDRLGLVPGTLRARARLKRLVYGRLRSVPPELEQGFAALADRVPVGSGVVSGFKVLYVTGRK